MWCDSQTSAYQIVDQVFVGFDHLNEDTDNSETITKQIADIVKAVYPRLVSFRWDSSNSWSELETSSN